jgi:predicted dehydrogenase
MRCVIIGLGVQGRKRQAIAGDDAAATVDPVAGAAQFKAIEQVPLGSYEAALVCTPDAAKPALLRYLLGHGKHVLVEKPMLADDPSQLHDLLQLARSSGAVCYTAYNHRFEPHLARVKGLLEEDVLGDIYLARMHYGNGTARDVRNSPWRDQGLGVLTDLGSHLLDLTLFLFGRPAQSLIPWGRHRFENKAFDHFHFGCAAAPGYPALNLEASLLSWRNTFYLDLYGARGSLHVNCLCKWGPSTLTIRKRVFPSGKPTEESQTLEQPDPTWALEYQHFKQACLRGGFSNLENDLWINSVFLQLGQSSGQGLAA